jgi:hypothetical protein
MERFPSHGLATAELAELAAWASRELRQGTLRWRDILGLTETELAAVEQVGERLRRRGQLSQAITIYGMLITHDPLKGSYWQSMAHLQRRCGQHAQAALCYEVLALLEGRKEEATHQQARCLEQLELQNGKIAS